MLAFDNGMIFENCDNEFDLFMATKKKTGWINIYNVAPNEYRFAIHSSKIDADNHAGQDRVDCIQIEWEE
ncbi:MAG: hypothetical protein KGJ07_00160 [Patescibacteria group bacterium]|nr:hypothetical protein [Patescibacteria group bacterium]